MHCCWYCFEMCAHYHMIKFINYGGYLITPLSKQLSKNLQGLGAPTSLGKYWKKQDYFSINGWDQMILQMGTNKIPHSWFRRINRRCKTKKFLDSVTIPRQWNNQENINTWVTHQGKIQGGNIQATGVFPGNVQRPKSLDPYSTQTRKAIKILQGKGRKTQKYRTPSSSDHQIYGKFPAKIFNTLFRKRTGRKKQDNKWFAKIWGKLIW